MLRHLFLGYIMNVGVRRCSLAPTFIIEPTGVGHLLALLFSCRLPLQDVIIVNRHCAPTVAETACAGKIFFAQLRFPNGGTADI